MTSAQYFRSIVFRLFVLNDLGTLFRVTREKPVAPKDDTIKFQESIGISHFYMLESEFKALSPEMQTLLSDIFEGLENLNFLSKKEESKVNSKKDSNG